MIIPDVPLSIKVTVAITLLGLSFGWFRSAIVVQGEIDHLTQRMALMEDFRNRMGEKITAIEIALSGLNAVRYGEREELKAMLRDLQEQIKRLNGGHAP